MRRTFGRKTHRICIFVLVGALSGVPAAGCRDPGGLDNPRTTIAVLAGDGQFGTAGANLADPIQVEVTDAVTHEPRSGITVNWQVTDGNGTVTPVTSTTDTRGIASATLHLGNALGTVHVRAQPAGLVGNPALFTANSVQTPAITAIAPATARAGDTITISGSSFGTATSAVSVLFDGIRGLIISVAPGQVRAVVPSCVATRNTAVRVTLGAVSSQAATLATTAGTTTALRLQRGEVRVFADPAELGCVRLPPDPAGATYMLIAQNVADIYSIPMPFTLSAFGVVPPLASALIVCSQSPVMQGTVDYAGTWELHLRERERALLAASPEAVPQAAIHSESAIPRVGDRRTFNTLTQENKSEKITAEVRAVTTRAILYQDVAAPNVLTNADYERFGALFDDPIYATDVNAFGPIGDIDGNGRIIMVFTSKVNALTPKGAGSYIAGYFYACDLLTRSRCSASNGGEIFYSIVPDPSGIHSDPHTAGSVLMDVPPVLAHEFMHMINYGARGGSLEALWLAEALAHTAEELVGQVFLERGNAVTAANFTSGNIQHARAYMSNPPGTSLIANESPGTLELRGAGWLFLRYLRGHYGENQLLKSLASARESGSRNVTARTGRTWKSLMTDFSTAIYADDAPDLAGIPVDPRYTFVNANLRTLLGTPGSYPLQVRVFAYTDFVMTGALPTSAWQYTYIQAPGAGSTTSLNLVYAGARGGPFGAAAVPQLTVLRVR
ncbi:MAG: IPT/TIG domain-containing protein [Longimicrobiales bacterium]